MTDSSQIPQPSIDSTMSIGRLSVPVDETIAAFVVTAEDAAAVAALPPGSALLIVQRGQVLGERFLLDADRVLAGRSVKADIFLDDVTVSRKHAEFVRDGVGGYLVRDVGSLNGTYVNRERIDSAALRPGDEVQIGKFRMSYQTRATSQPAVAAAASLDPEAPTPAAGIPIVTPLTGLTDGVPTAPFPTS